MVTKVETNIKMCNGVNLKHDTMGNQQRNSISNRGRSTTIIYTTETEMTYKIYFAEFEDGKKYIGQTCSSLEVRINQHEQKCKYDNSKFYKKLRNSKNVIWGILERNISFDEIDDKERFYISKYNTINDGYNTKNGGVTWNSTISHEEIKLIYKELKTSMTLSEIAEKHHILLETVSHINKGTIYHCNDVKYPIKKTYHNLSDDEVLEIAEQLTREYHLQDLMTKYNVSRKSIQNINNGMTHKKILAQNGYIEFPLHAEGIV